MPSIKKRKSKAKFRVNDIVRIINPEFFVRCGYTFCLEDELNKFTDKDRENVCGLLRSFGIRTGLVDYDWQKSFDKILREIAFLKIKQGNFGGRDRKIFTKSYPELVNKECSIVDIRYAKTGTYHPMSGHCTLDGDEIDPPYLSDEKTHRILEVSLWDENKYNHLKIEDINVIKMEGDYVELD